MYKLGLSEAGHSISDKPFTKKSHPVINKNVSPQGHVLSSNPQDSKILCKRIDNTTLNVPTKSEQEALGQKFVPLAFPLEKMKKKTTHSQSQAVSQESKSKNTSIPHSVNISGQPSRNQSMPQVLGKAPNASGYNLTFNIAEAGNLPEPKGLKAIKKSKANQSMEEIPKASIEYEEGRGSPLKSKENKVLKLRKKSAKKSSGNIKKGQAKENMIVDVRPKSRMSVGHVERENEEGKIKHKPSEEKPLKSGKGSKNSSPSKSHYQVEKKEKRKVKKREQVSKSEIPAAFEEMIQKSAHEYMEDLKAKKHVSELEKVLFEEKKAALEQGNKMIRISNLQRFNPHHESMEDIHTRHAWGVDQRKFEKKNERQGSRTPPPKKKIDEKERRKVLGLDQFDESRLQQRKSVKERNTSQREASEEKKSKRELDKSEHARIQEYMYQKRVKIEQEKYEKEHEANEEYDRKKRNLEQLFYEIRYNREKESKKPRLSKKRPKSRKTHKSSLSPARVSQREEMVHRKGESMIYHNEMNEDNYQALYDEYKNIINAKSKKKSRDVSPNDRSSTRNRNRNLSSDGYRHIEEQGEVYEHSSGRNVKESQRLKAKYQEIKQRESEEYTSQNTMNRNPLESSPQKTTQKEVSPIKKKIKEKVDENKIKKSRRAQQHTGGSDAAQDIINEMETDNFSDNDNLRSERMIIRERYERPIIEEEDLSMPGFRTYENIPQESTREVMEAAAIFIQKNYRGYRTRKLIKMYFDQICREGLDFTDEEERHVEDEDEDDIDDRYEQRRSHKGQQSELIKVQDEKYPQGKNKGKNVYEDDDEEESEDEEEEEENERKKNQFLDPTEKKSIYDLLERQKRLIGQGESEKQGELEDEDEFYERKLREIQEQLDAGEKLTYEEELSAKQSEELDSQLAKADYMKYLEQIGQMKGEGSESEDYKQSGGGESNDIDQEEYYQQMEYLRFRDQIHSQLVGLKEKYNGSPDIKQGQDNRRIKSDGEREGQQGMGEQYGDTEESDQISLHHEYMRKDYQKNRSNNDIPKNSASVSERDTGSYAEEFRSSMPEATPIKDTHSRSGNRHNELIQVPTVESMSIPTKSVLDSQLFMNPSIHKELNSHNKNNVDNMDLSTHKKDAQALAQIKSNSSVASNVIGSQSKKSSESTNKQQASSGRKSGADVMSKRSPGAENILQDKRRINFPESSDSSRKKTLTKSESDQFRDQLINELKAMEEEKGDRIKQKTTGGNKPTEALIDNYINKPMRKIKQIEKSSSGSRHDKEFDYQNELTRLREEQAKQWNEVLKQLNALRTEENTELNEKVREFIENLASQSEINRRRLIDSVELQNIIKTQSGQSDEKSIINDLDSLMKNNHYTLTTENQITVQTPKDDDIVVMKDTQDSVNREKRGSSSSEKKTSQKKKRFEFGKKNNLEINVDLVNDEKTSQGNNNASELAAAGAAGAEIEEMNLDLSQMRMALGSEQLVREQSARTLTQSVSTPRYSELGSLNNLKTPDNSEGLVNLFGRDPFQEFANKRFKELISQDSMQQLIQMREQALEVRHKAHIETINKMFENRRYSPRTFQNKKIELEKWVNKERDNIQKSRKDIEKGWTSTQDSIKKTQRDLEFLNKVAAHSGSKSSAQKLEERSIEPSNRTATKEGGAHIRSPMAKFELPEDSIYSTSSKKNNDEEETKTGLHALDDIQLELKSPQGEKTKTPSKFSPGAKSASKYETVKSDSSYHGARLEDITIDTTEQGSKEIRSRKPIGSPHIESDNTGSSKYLNQSESVIETNVGFDNKFISSRLSTQKEDKPVEISSRISPKSNKTGGISQAKERRNKLAPLEPEDAEAVAVNLTPKTPQELRNLFNEQIEVLKASTSYPDLTQKVLEETNKSTSQKNLETVAAVINEAPVIEKQAPVETNLQKKVDLITEEVFNSLFDELGKEFGNPEKERVAGKVKGIDDHNPVLGKQHLVDNKEFFTHGAEKHHNFQANIPIIPAAIVEHEKLDEVHDIIKEEERIYDELERYENLYDQGVMRENTSQPIKSDEHEKLLDDDRDKHQQHQQHQQQQQQQQQLFDTQAEIFRNLAIKTDLKSLENYLDMLLTEIKGSYMDEFLTNINIPIGLNIGEKLNNMHAYDLAGSESSLEMSDGLQRAILSIHLYLKVEEALMEQNPSRNEVITELEHIHNKMVFDCLNEILDFYRPHGLVGEPYPWKLSVRVNKPPTITNSHVEKILRECKKKVMEWAAFMCGYYGERDDFIRDRTNSYAEEYLAQIKEERLSKMLAAEVYEMEDKWINYDDEEAEVELEISDLVFDKLVTETAELIMRINEQRGGPKRVSPEKKLKIQDDKKRRKKSL